MLVEMDGFEVSSGVVVLAATNRADVLDPALLRPGRFDRLVTVDAPDQAGRLRILELHARTTPLSPDADLHLLARRTPGLTGADLAGVVTRRRCWRCATVAARSVATTSLLDDEVRRHVEHAAARAAELVTVHRRVVDPLVDALVEAEHVEGAALAQLLARVGLPSRGQRAARAR